MRALFPLLLLAGCGPVVQVGRPPAPPAEHYVLSAPPGEAVPAGVTAVDPARAVSVLAINAPSALATVRMPVRTDSTRISYLKAGEWSEPPARMLGRLIEVRLAGDGVPVIDRRVTGRAAPTIVGGTLRAFEIDMTGASPKAQVRFDATLAGPGGTRLRSFDAEVPMARVEAGEAARALNQAANEVAAGIAAWVAGSGKSGS